MNRDVTLKIRVKDEERALIQAAANAAGLSLSAWVRMLAVKVAKKEIRK